MLERERDTGPSQAFLEQSYQLGVVGTDNKERKFKVVDRNNRISKGAKYSFGPGELTQTVFVRDGRSKHCSFINGTDNGSI